MNIFLYVYFFHQIENLIGINYFLFVVKTVLLTVIYTNLAARRVVLYIHYRISIS